jgi:cell filamentation protein
VSGAAGDPYADPASGVLRNLLGITDAAELAQAEAALSASRLIDLELRRLPGRYDLAHLQAFHRYILGDIYGWAGQLRTVSIAKGSVFCLPQHLESYAADVFGRLGAADRLRGLARDPFIAALAGFLADVNALHPFREGNGRAQRAFFSQLAHDAGHHIAWVRMDPGRNMAASATALRRPGPAAGDARPADRPAAPLRTARAGRRTRSLTSRHRAASLTPSNA